MKHSPVWLEAASKFELASIVTSRQNHGMIAMSHASINYSWTSLQGMQSNFGEKAMGNYRIEDSFWKWRPNGCWHIQFNDFHASRSCHSTVGIHRIFGQQSELIDAQCATRTQSLTLIQNQFVRISRIANRFARFEDWLRNGGYPASPVRDDTISIQSNRLLCTQSSRGWFGFLWWGLEFTAHGIYCAHCSKFTFGNCKLMFDLDRWFLI